MLSRIPTTESDLTEQQTTSYSRKIIADNFFARLYPRWCEAVTLRQFLGCFQSRHDGPWRMDSHHPLLTQLDTQIKRKRDQKRAEAQINVNTVTSPHFLAFSCKFQAWARFIFDYVQLCSTLAIYSFLMLGEFEIVYIKCGRAKMRASRNGLREFLCMCV